MGGDAGLKAIAKRTKANGLGRLRWYCQMCEKQCRDENGFKCHTNTPAHQRQLVLFANQPELFVDRFSTNFLSGFLLVMRQHGTNAVAANNVYQEYIKDKHHVHMNSTRWTTLTDFVKELGRKGICRVEYREDALWLVYVDRSAIERKRQAQEITRVRLNEEEREERELALRMERASRDGDQRRRSLSTTLKGTASGSAPVRMFIADAERAGRSRQPKGILNAFANLESTKRPSDVNTEMGKSKREASVVEQIMNSQLGGRKFEIMSRPREAARKCEPESDNAKNNCRPQVTVSSPQTRISKSSPAHEGPEGVADGSESPWLVAGISVKCVGDALRGTDYHNKKGVVQEVKDQFAAVVRLRDSGAVLLVDQDDLQTVIPKTGGRVLLLRGARRGRSATVLRIVEDRFCVHVKLEKSPDGGSADTLDLPYESVSKMA